MVPFLLGDEGARNKRSGSVDSGVDQPCVAGQNLAMSFRTAMLSYWLAATGPALCAAGLASMAPNGSGHGGNDDGDA